MDNNFNTANTNKYTFGFILNKIDIGDLSSNHDFGGWILRKSSDIEMELIINILNKMPDNINNYLLQFYPKEINSNKTIFAVLESNSNAVEYRKLQESLLISNNNLRLELWGSIGKNSKCTSYNGSKLYQYYDNIPNDINTNFNADHLKEIIELRRNFDDAKFPKILDAIQLFMQCDVISDESNLKIISYFALIESLLSHKQKTNESADSITNQLKRNIILLDNRLKLNGSSYNFEIFKNSNNIKIISDFYALRSEIAHGGNAGEIYEKLDKSKPSCYNGMTARQ